MQPRNTKQKVATARVAAADDDDDDDVDGDGRCWPQSRRGKENSSKKCQTAIDLHDHKN